MRAIRPTLTPELKRHCGSKPVWRATAFEVATYRKLIEHVACLAYLNRDELLFFRGQDKDFQNKAGGTTLYPSIYREDAVPTYELRHRFEMLEKAGRMLAERFKKAHIDGHRELRRRRYVQWGILQHYGVSATPLIDLTHSLRVACSFAQLSSSDPTCYVYVLGLPYLTNRISINSEHDLVNVRLLRICPPAALRPYSQEGYLVGTADVTTDFESKTELDFRNRLIAKFAIPRAQTFWGTAFSQIRDTELFPRGDKILDLCDELKGALHDEIVEGDIGTFVKQWATLEKTVLENARRLTERNVSVREAIWNLTKMQVLPSDLAQKLDGLRAFRNLVVHHPQSVQTRDLSLWLEEMRKISQLVRTKLVM
jgi:hypothetical protein